MLLVSFRRYRLKIGLNNVAGYQGPINANAKYMGTPYMFLGFIPASAARNKNIQGLMINGRQIKFR